MSAVLAVNLQTQRPSEAPIYVPILFPGHTVNAEKWDDLNEWRGYWSSSLEMDLHTLSRCELEATLRSRIEELQAAYADLRATIG